MNAAPLAASVLALAILAGCATLDEAPDDPLLASPEVASLLAAAHANPLLAPWRGPYGGLPPWELLKPKLFPEAFELGIALQEAQSMAIAQNPAPPTFENTIEAMQRVSYELARADALFSVLKIRVSTPDVQQIEAEWSQRMTRSHSEMTSDPAMFARIDGLYRRRASLDLDAQQLRLLELMHESRVASRPALDPTLHARLDDINSTLLALYAEFDKRLRADEFTPIYIEREEDLAGFPQEWRDAFARAARQFGRPGEWAVLNTSVGVNAVLWYAEDRALRERAWRAYQNRGDNGDANDTNELVAQIIALRTERARLHGNPTHAHFRMVGSMARDPARVQELLMRLWPSAVARAREELADAQEVAHRTGADFTIEPWDYPFYAVKLRRERLPVDYFALRKYFQLDNMIAAAFYMAKQLYGLDFVEATGTVAAFHPDVRVFEARDRDGSIRSVFYLDCFARPGKQPGSWSTVYRPHHGPTGERVPALSANYHNFPKPAVGESALLTLVEARALFREFTSAILVSLNETRYAGLARPPGDYEPYLGRLHERWVLAQPILDRFALHVETGEPMPPELLDQVRQSDISGKGYGVVEWLASALVDLAAHTRPDGDVDPDVLEREVLEQLGLRRPLMTRYRLPQFRELFAGDTALDVFYRSVWADLLVADTWAMFEETGDVFDPRVAAGLRKIIIAEGNSSDRNEAYRRFRGRDPDVRALMRDWGFPEGE